MRHIFRALSNSHVLDPAFLWKMLNVSPFMGMSGLRMRWSLDEDSISDTCGSFISVAVTNT